MVRKRWLSKIVATLCIGSLLAGCGTGATAQKSVKIGAIFPLTGGSAYEGQSFKNAIELARDEINANGGVNGVKLDIIFQDDKSKPAEGVSAAQKLITQDKVVALLGAFNSSVTLAIEDVSKREKVVQITPGSTADAVTEQGNPYMYRNILPNKVQGKAIADYAVTNLGLHKFAILAENTDYGRSGATVFENEVKAKGGSVIVKEYYNQGDTDFYVQLTKLKNSGAEGTFIAGLITEGAQIVKQARDLGVKTQFLGMGGFTNNKFHELAGGAEEGMIHSSYFEPDAYQYFPDSKSFVEAYKKKYGVDPDMYAAGGYEAVYILAEAMKTGGFDREGIQKGMKQIKDLPGVQGPTTFDDKGQASKHLLFVKWSGGKRVVIGSDVDNAKK